MKRATQSLLRAATLGLALTTAHLFAADHGDAPNMDSDQGADIADVFAFLDPNDNTQVVLIGTVHGFIVPSEANNFGVFDEDVRFSFHIENTGDSAPDMFIDVTFNHPQRPPDGKDLPGFKGTARGIQDAFISFRGKAPANLVGVKGKSHAPVTQPTLAAVANNQVVTDLKNAKNEDLGIKFFAGEVDDPFFFDIPGFNRFVASVLAGTPDLTRLDRARDSFAGYNILAIALRVPANKLVSAKANTPTKIGVAFSTARKTQHPVKGDQVGAGGYVQVDRLGVPGVNVAFIPYNDKNAYNGSTTIDDGKGKFFNDIAGTLTALGTTNSPGNPVPTALSILASVAGLPSTFPIPRGDSPGTGDYLRLETNSATKPNPAMGGSITEGGSEGGGLPGSGTNGFPNGRRLKDDVIDTILFLVTNGALTTGDKVNGNDKTFQNQFPFVALPQQPLENPTVDGTQN
jgi:hypothetical protein